MVQCDAKSPDTYRALLRTGNTASIIIFNLKPSVYRVTLYDLEQDGLPSESLAYEVSGNIIVKNQSE